MLNTHRWPSLLAAALVIANLAAVVPVSQAISTVYLFAVLTLVPGTLILINLAPLELCFAEAAVYAVGLSVAFLMGMATLATLVLPHAGFMHPLDKPPLLACLDLWCTLLLVRAVRRPRHHVLRLQPIRLGRLDLLLAVPATALPLLSAVGAARLNNGGSATPSLAVFVVVGLLGLLVVALRRGLSEALNPYLLFISCLSLVLTLSLRGWIISGHDVLYEYRVFEVTKHALRWNIGYLQDAYNACLSITVLPTVYAVFLGMDQEVFRICFQIIFAMTAVALYLLARRFVSPLLAFLTSLFFISQPPLLADFPFMVRQEVAFLFYALCLLALFNRTLARPQKVVLFLTFTSAMTVSHYSTTYFALASLLVTYGLGKVIGAHDAARARVRWERVADAVHYEEPPTAGRRQLSAVMVAVPILVAYLWYGPLTHTSSNLTSFLASMSRDAGRILNPSTAGSLLDQFTPFKTPADPRASLAAYVKHTEATYRQAPYITPYNPALWRGYDPFVKAPFLLPARVNPHLAGPVYLAGELIKKAVKLFTVLGIVLLLARAWTRHRVDEFVLMVLANSMLLVGAILLPIIAVAYDVERAYQQSLVVLALPAVVGGVACCRLLPRLSGISACDVTGVVLVLYYLFVSPVAPQVLGQGYAYMQLNNYGLYYNLYYSHPSELAAVKWLMAHRDPRIPIYADWYAERKIDVFASANPWIIDNVLPADVSRNAYVFSDFTNTTLGIAYTYASGETPYRFPTRFLGKAKDVIYTSGTTRIYR